jgi:CRISPR-associated protein Cas5t
MNIVSPAFGSTDTVQTTLSVVRVEIRAYSASFRLPGMMGYQTTSPVPPPSTVYGILAAACGREVTPEECSVAYHFSYEARAHDLEKIIIFGPKGPSWDAKLNGPSSNVLQREWLWNPCLTLYVTLDEVAQALRFPHYPLVLGRSQDVAYVASWQETTLQAVESAPLSGVLLPFPVRDSNLRSRLASFPTFFTVEAQRSARAVKPFHIVECTANPKTVRAPNLWRERTETLSPRSTLGVPLFTSEVLS